MATLRGFQQPELSKKLFKIIKNENAAISAYECAGRERVSIASQLSDWGESTGDETISDISDKMGVLLAEIGEQEDMFAQNLEDYRGTLKQIRDMESSVQPSRDHRTKVADEIQKLKYKDPASTKLVTLEQELVRAEAQNLVAEAQLTNTTRRKFKEAFELHLVATIERAEKQTILARHARRLLPLIDDSAVVPGDQREQYEHGSEARRILNDAESDLRAWEFTVEPISPAAAADETSKYSNEQADPADGSSAIPTSEDGTRTCDGGNEATPLSKEVTGDTSGPERDLEASEENNAPA
ncbi:hypothetical protein Egran_05058 [Elaphomyces granulatus]|uniref:Sphingolipid long chain base-responsive protein LSP1 n=1 Tax=Elaphomyces granulatus TaxID=519963 RepID=A0A232LSN3_9EURO|nr:hypothetical protein Egran_05058 [Elaphomyces granulatus]